MIILQGAVNGEADLQMCCMWITANYWIIRRPECWLPSLQHADSKKQGNPGDRLGCGQRAVEATEKGSPTPSAQPPRLANHSQWPSEGLPPASARWLMNSTPHPSLSMPDPFFQPFMSPRKHYSQPMHPLYQYRMNITSHRMKRMEK